MIFIFLLKEVKYKNILDVDSLVIPRLKTTFIVGGSGSGKSTLLKLLNKLISPDSGSLYYKNKPLGDIFSVDLRRKVVMLSQDPTIFPGTVKDNLIIGLTFSEKEIVSDSELNLMLKLVSLNKDLDEDSHTLSGGEKQRLSLGRVLLLNPEVLLLDEPSSALDDDTEMSVIATLLDYAKKKDITPIVVTHSKVLKDTFSENTIEVDKGKIVCREEH